MAIGLCLGASAAHAQLSALPQLEGPYNYVATGNTFRSGSNTGDPCAVNASSAASVTVPATSTGIVAAYLFWGGSGGTTDASVTLNTAGVGNSNRTADGTAAATYPYNGDNLQYFTAYDVVTDRIVATPGATTSYTLSNLAVDVDEPYCTPGAVTKGWALVVIYQNPSLPLRRMEFRHGARALRQASEVVNMTGYVASANPVFDVLFLLYEGDPDITGSAGAPEAVVLNGATLSSGVNPATNPYNSTRQVAGSPTVTNTYGMDLDQYSISPTPYSSSASATLTAGTDLVILQMMLTSVTMQGVLVTPDGLATPVSRLPGTRYGQTFSVTNTSITNGSFDILASSTGGFMTVDSITYLGTRISTAARPDSARLTAMTAGSTRNVNVYYSVAVGTPVNGTVDLRARWTSYPTKAEGNDPGWAEVRRVIPQLTLTRSVTFPSGLDPGVELTYTLQTSNVGEYAATGVTVSDSVASQVAFKVGSMSAPLLPAGVTAAVSYSNQTTGAVWTYVPVSGACGAATGYDACVRRVRWSLTGDVPVGAPSAATFQFIAAIR